MTDQFSEESRDAAVDWDGQDRRGEREIPVISPELQEAISGLDPKQQKVIKLLWSNITLYAVENAKRLDEASRIIKRISKVVIGSMVVLALTLLAFGAASLYFQNVQNNNVENIKQGRKTSLNATCAALSAISEAGRKTISSSGATPISVKAEIFLGLPPLTPDQRKALAQQQGNAYVTGISDKIDAAVGGKRGDGLVNKDGTLNCVRLAQIARIGATGVRKNSK